MVEFEELEELLIDTDKEIDLYITKGIKNYMNKNKNSNMIVTVYVKLHDMDERIGYISLRFGDAKKYIFANIGYEIDEMYRGNNYTLKALNLLKDFMIENGMNKPVVIISKDNIPSNKVIQRFGGYLISNFNDGFENINTYEVDLDKTR